MKACASCLGVSRPRKKHFGPSQRKSLTWISVTKWAQTGASGIHCLAGGPPPTFTLGLEDGTVRITQLMCAGRGVLVDLANRSPLRGVVEKWADRVEAISACCSERPASLEAVLIRPDGYVGWSLDPAMRTRNLPRVCVPRWRNGSAAQDSMEFLILRASDVASTTRPKRPKGAGIWARHVDSGRRRS
jgi:hypothetical protein